MIVYQSVEAYIVHKPEQYTAEECYKEQVFLQINSKVVEGKQSLQIHRHLYLLPPAQKQLLVFNKHTSNMLKSIF